MRLFLVPALIYGLALIGFIDVCAAIIKNIKKLLKKLLKK